MWQRTKKTNWTSLPMHENKKTNWNSLPMHLNVIICLLKWNNTIYHLTTDYSINNNLIEKNWLNVSNDYDDEVRWRELVDRWYSNNGGIISQDGAENKKTNWNSLPMHLNVIICLLKWNNTIYHLTTDYSINNNLIE